MSKFSLVFLFLDVLGFESVYKRKRWLKKKKHDAWILNGKNITNNGNTRTIFYKKQFSEKSSKKETNTQI